VTRKPTSSRAALKLHKPKVSTPVADVNYALRIETLRPSYSCRLVTTDQSAELIETSEYTIGAVCLAPAKVAGRAVRVRVIGIERQHGTKYHKDAVVGVLTLRGKASELLCWLPDGSLHWAMQHALGGRYRFIVATAEPIKHGYANVHAISFEPHLDPEDFPGVDQHG
jgi:hypothetical protein